MTWFWISFLEPSIISNYEEENVKIIDLHKEIKSSNKIHQRCSGSEDESIIDGTPIHCEKTTFEPLIIDENNDQVHDLKPHLSEIEFKKEHNSFEGQNETDGGCETKSTIIIEQDDASKKNSIEKLNCLEKDKLSNITEGENNFSPWNKELNEVSNCLFEFQKPFEDLAYQTLAINTTIIDDYVSTDITTPTVEINDLSSNFVVHTDTIPKSLNKFGRIMKHEANNGGEENMHHFDDSNKINISPSIKNIYISRSPSLNSSPRIHNKQQQHRLVFITNVFIW